MHTVHVALLRHRRLTKENQRSKEHPCCPPLPKKVVWRASCGMPRRAWPCLRLPSTSRVCLNEYMLVSRGPSVPFQRGLWVTFLAILCTGKGQLMPRKKVAPVLASATSVLQKGLEPCEPTLSETRSRFLSIPTPGG